MRFSHLLCRNAILLAMLCCASFLPAKVVWLVGQKAAVDAPAVAQELSQMLNGETVEVVDFTWLSAWVNTPDKEGVREKLLAADTLLVTLSPQENLGLAFLGLTTIKAIRPKHLSNTTLVAVQKPIYRMSGLCNNNRLQETARLSLGANLDFIALPKVWQQVYTDDTFYNDKVPKGAPTETYVAAAGLALSLKGINYPLPPLNGIHPDLAEELIQSVQKGLDLREDVLYAAEHLPRNSFNLRTGNTFDAILYDGAFERKIGAWLDVFAKAEGRQLTIHYTTDTGINTGWPALYRTVHKLGKMPNALVYTRPAFKDNSGLTELEHLGAIYKSDVNKKNWIPFPLAVAEWVRRYPNIPVYDGAEPTDSTAAMFAAMVYIQWTGAVVLPTACDQQTATAINIGIETMLRQVHLRRDVNAILCRSLGENRFAFSLWRRPTETISIRLDTNDPSKRVSERKLTFNKNNYWSPQTVTVDAPCTFLWKIPAKYFPGQNTGARVLE